GIDHERPLPVVAGELEADLTVAPEDVTGPDLVPGAANLLIGHRCLPGHVAAGGMEDEVPRAVEAQAGDALEAQTDDLRARPGGDHEVVLDLPLVRAVVHEVHTAVDPVVADRAIAREAGAPGGGIVADEVMALAGQRRARSRRRGPRTAPAGRPGRGWARRPAAGREGSSARRCLPPLRNGAEDRSGWPGPPGPRRERTASEQA